MGQIIWEFAVGFFAGVGVIVTIQRVADWLVNKFS